MAEPDKTDTLTPEEAAAAETAALLAKVAELEAALKESKDKKKPPTAQEKAEAKDLLEKLAQLEAENASYRDAMTNAKATTGARMENVPSPIDPDEEYVTVELFYDGDKYKDDVFVCVNGENCLIQRGKPVKIKRKFANILKASDLQDKYARDIIQGFADEFKEASKALN